MVSQNARGLSQLRGACPDLTRGERIPEGWTHDWTLGPTGTRGWIYCDTGVTTDARQIQITKVEKGSPADGLLEVGDVITGVQGKPFGDDARILFGKAITEAEMAGRIIERRVGVRPPGRAFYFVLSSGLSNRALGLPQYCSSFFAKMGSRSTISLRLSSDSK